jgi:hypothetical protein
LGSTASSDCEVLAIDPPRLPQISWRGDQRLDSTLTWRLEPRGTGTRPYLEHTGFDPDDPFQRLAHVGMDRGWRSRVLRRLHVCLDADS